MYDFIDFVKGNASKVFGVVLLGVFLTILVVVLAGAPVFSLAYYSSCRQAEVFNSTNNTTYSCSDFFWASNQINNNTQTLKLK